MENETFQCPLCDRTEAEGNRIDLRIDLWRVECPYCTTYEVTQSVTNWLAEDAEAKGHAGLVSDACRRATHVLDKTTTQNVLERCLQIRNREDFWEIFRGEQSLQGLVSPAVEYLISNGMRITGKYTHPPFEYVEVEVSRPNQSHATLKLETRVLYHWSEKEIQNYLRDHAAAERLKKGETFEINMKSAKPRWVD